MPKPAIVQRYKLQAKDETGRAVRSANKNIKSFSKTAIGAVKGLASVYAAYEGAKFIVRQGNAWQNLTNRLKVVTNGTEELARAQQTVIDIANKTRSPLEGTAQLYSRLALASEEMGLSQARLANLTETVNKTLAIGGATTQEATGAMIQFAQAVASNRLSGEELRSVMENAPQLARTLAEGLGVGIGKLREMGKSGELTADQVIAALEKMKDKVDNDFAKIAPTLAQQFTITQNKLLELFGKDSQTTRAIGSTLGLINDFLDSAALTGLVDVLSFSLKGYLDFIDKVGEGIDWLKVKFIELGLVSNSTELMDALEHEAERLKKLKQAQALLAGEVNPLNTLNAGRAQALYDEAKANRKRIEAEIKKTAELANEEKAKETGKSKTREEAIANTEFHYQQLRLKRWRDYWQAKEDASAAANVKAFEEGNEFDAEEAERQGEARLEYRKRYNERMLELATQQKEKLGELGDFAQSLGLIPEDTQTEFDKLQAYYDELEAIRQMRITEINENIYLSESQKQAQLTAITKQGEEARADLEAKMAKLKQRVAIDSLKTVLGSLAQHSKAAFNINKGFSIVTAVINTYEGITKALAAYPPPINFVKAAAVGAAGFAKVAAIKSTSFGSGGGGSGGVSAGAGGGGAPTQPPASASSNLPTNPDGSPQGNFFEPTQVKNIYIERGALVTPEMIAEINELGEDNARVNLRLA